MLINHLIVILTGFFSAVLLISIIRKISLRYHLLIRQGIPLIGGLGIGLSFIIACTFSFFIFQRLSQEMFGIIASSLIMLVFGVIDDGRELSIRAKFITQIVATVLLISSGTRTQIIYIGNILNIIITFIWVIGITNAFNHLDVMDGLAAGAALIVSLAFLTISFLNYDIQTIILSLAVTGSILGFLIYNFPPAKVYMGNSGSHFLGFFLAAVALAISYAPLERKIALLSPLLILGFPIFDTVFLIFVRMSNKRSAFKKSADHLALRFLKLGYSKNKALLSMLILAWLFSFSGILVSQVANTLGIIIIVFIVLVSLAVTREMSKVKIEH